MSNMRAFLEQAYGKYYAEKYLAKSDDPILSTEAGYANVVYGARAFTNILWSGNTFAVLTKDAYNKENPDGMRLMYATGTKATGIQENAALPDTDKPDVLEVSVGFKEIVTAFEVSNKAILKARNNDYVDLIYIFEVEGELHTAGMNDMLLEDADTLAGYDLESIDRVTISEAAVTALSYTAGDNDMYSLDIGTYTWFDPITDHNSGTDREWNFGYFFENSGAVRNNNGIVTKGITKPDTYGQMMASAQIQARYNPSGFTYTATEEGPKAVSGGEIGYAVATIDGCPIFQDPGVQADGIGRLYLLDDRDMFGSPTLSLNIASPTKLTTANNAVLLDALKEKSAYDTSAELRCRSRFRQASIRDLKAASL